ncbi:hypothetical protein ACHWQZ_G015799 [Mnemiopsis leidyi]
MDINGPAPPNETFPLAKYATDNNLPRIMGSDTNSHHTLWGNRACNERGRELLDFLSSLGLNWANKGSTPTFLNTRGHNSIIDLTITNPTGDELISNWHVSDLFSNSDHRYIMFDITTGHKKEPKQIRLVRNTDWVKFNEILKNDPNLNNTTITNTNDIDQKVEYINQALNKAFEEACSATYISSTIRKPSWLTPQIEEAQRGIKHKPKLTLKKKTQAHWDALKETNRIYNQTIRKAQKEAWRTFCKETESIKESARMNNILKSTNNRTDKLEAVYKPDGTLTNSSSETLDIMASTHIKEGTEEYVHTTTTALNITNDLLNKIYSEDRLDKAIKSFEPYKAAGPDNLQPIIIQNAWSHISSLTRAIMKKSHETQHIPKPWRNSRGIFIPKPGKADYNQPKSYRTITLSPVMLKLQEKVILLHMQNDLKIAQDTNKRQFGFKRGCSTEAALHKVTHMIERRIAKKGYVLGVFLDIEAAFDNVSFKAIANALRDNPDTYRTQLQNIINERPEDWITCYTDGSKTEEGCGAGTIQSNTASTFSTESELERADKLAKHGTTSTTTIARTIPQAYINKLINDKVHKLNTDIVNKDCPRHTKLILGRNHTKIINNLNRSFINNRKDYRTATQLITGHCGLNKHLYNMNKTTTKECPLCGHHEETVNHFLGQCPALAQTRGQYFNDFYLSANDIFDNIHITTIINYVNKTRRLMDPEDLDNTGVT